MWNQPVVVDAIAMEASCQLVHEAALSHGFAGVGDFREGGTGLGACGGAQEEDGLTGAWELGCPPESAMHGVVILLQEADAVLDDVRAQSVG